MTQLTRSALLFALLLASCRRREETASSAAAPAVPTLTPAPAPSAPAPAPTTQTGPFGIPIPAIPGLPTLGTPQPNQGPAAPQGASAIETAPLPPGAVEPDGSFTLPFLEQEAQYLISTLSANLEPNHRSRVANIPLNFVNSLTEVNAAAGCTRGGRAFMVATAAILVIHAATAEARAVDEIAGTRLLQDYTDRTVRMINQEQLVRGLPDGVVPSAMAFNPQKLARQRYLYDVQIAFILGHELAHHYRGHTGCANGAPATQQQGDLEDLERAVSNLAPLFNQPLEVESDTWGTVNVLDTGSRRTTGRWTEEGAVMSMNFFERLEGLRGSSPLLYFVRSHPPAAIRRPVIQLWSSQWRSGVRPPAIGAAQGGSNGGSPLPFPLPFPLPGR
ncbi:MAG: hypothetical protein IPF99_40430 [Deltaproteobacteria bacterium]|nr:hypothetical protein [Deltaproteobacteria bacterium]